MEIQVSIADGNIGVGVACGLCSERFGFVAEPAGMVGNLALAFLAEPKIFEVEGEAICPKCTPKLRGDGGNATA